MNNMKSLALLLLSLITGCEAESVVRGCAGGWVELTCNYINDTTLFKLNTSRDRNDMFYSYYEIKRGRVRIYKDPSKEHAGIYRCQNNTASEQLILNVSADDHICQKRLHQTAYTGTETTFTCEYPGNSESNVEFFCKDKTDTCEEILSTESSQRSNGTFSLTITTSGFNVSIKDVSSQDAGVYWCGLKIQDDKKTRVGLRRIKLNVTIQPSAPTPASAENQGRFKVLVTVIISVVVLLLLLPLILIPVTKRIRLSRSDSRRNEAAAQQDREEHLQTPDSRNATNTVHVPDTSNRFSSPIYATVNHQNGSDRAGGEALFPRTSSSSCEYSTVKCFRSPTDSTVIQPPRAAEVPLYSTVYNQAARKHQP